MEQVLELVEQELEESELGESELVESDQVEDFQLDMEQEESEVEDTQEELEEVEELVQVDMQEELEEQEDSDMELVVQELAEAILGELAELVGLEVDMEQVELAQVEDSKFKDMDIIPKINKIFLRLILNFINNPMDIKLIRIQAHLFQVNTTITVKQLIFMQMFQKMCTRKA